MSALFTTQSTNLGSQNAHYQIVNIGAEPEPEPDVLRDPTIGGLPPGLDTTEGECDLCKVINHIVWVLGILTEDIYICPHPDIVPDQIECFDVSFPSCAFDDDGTATNCDDWKIADHICEPNVIMVVEVKNILFNGAVKLNSVTGENLNSTLFDFDDGGIKHAIINGSESWAHTDSVGTLDFCNQGTDVRLYIDGIAFVPGNDLTNAFCKSASGTRHVGGTSPDVPGVPDDPAPPPSPPSKGKGTKAPTKSKKSKKIKKANLGGAYYDYECEESTSSRTGSRSLTTSPTTSKRTKTTKSKTSTPAPSPGIEVKTCDQCIEQMQQEIEVPEGYNAGDIWFKFNVYSANDQTKNADIEGALLDVMNGMGKSIILGCDALESGRRLAVGDVDMSTALFTKIEIIRIGNTGKKYVCLY